MTGTPLITASPTAARLLAERCRAQGRQVLLLGCWTRPSVVTVRDARGFQPDGHHALLGEVAGCPVYADLQCVQPCPHGRLIIEVRHTGPELPVFVARGESEGERQDRVLRDWVRRPDGARP